METYFKKTPKQHLIYQKSAEHRVASPVKTVIITLQLTSYNTGNMRQHCPVVKQYHDLLLCLLQRPASGNKQGPPNGEWNKDTPQSSHTLGEKGYIFAEPHNILRTLTTD